MVWRRVALGVCASALALSCTACGSAGPSLTSAGMASVTEGAARVHQGDTVTIGSMFACLDTSGSVKVLKVEPVAPVGLKVTGWAIRPNPFWEGRPPPANPAHIRGQIGTARTTLARLAFPSSRTIDADAQCGKQGRGYEFAVQVEKTTAGEAGAHAWTATYRSGGETKT